MATTSFSSVGSGIDFSSITESIVAQQSKPLTALASRRTDYQNRSDALKQLNAKLITLTEASRALTDRTVGTGKAANSGNTTILTASAAEGSTNGTLTVGVTRLASTLTQATKSFSSKTGSILSNGATSATFELRTGGASTGKPITVDSSNDSLQGLRDAINGANAGVTAAIVDTKGDGTGNQLVLTSTATGAAGRVELVETTSPSTGTAADLGVTSINPPGASNDFSALDAQISVNGLTITRPTNTVSDAVTGVTLNLKATGTTTATVSQNTAALADKFQGFVDAYNAVQDFVSGQYATDSKGRPTGALAGDATLRNVQASLRDVLNSSFANDGGSLSNLTQVGLGRDATGKLKIDSTVLNDKLKSSFSDVQALFSGKTAANKGFANQFLTASSALSDNVSGVVQNAISGYATSIAGIDKTISRQTDRLTALRASLTKQFAAADAAIGNLNNQNTAVAAALKSLNSSNSNN